MPDLTALVMTDDPSPQTITNMWRLLAALCAYTACLIFAVVVILRAKQKAKKAAPAEPAIETLEEVA
jgi:MinD-like ATPase involved in chromosome partitioning or flagellar assembly